MEFKDIWKDKVDDVDEVLAEDINLIAGELIKTQDQISVNYIESKTIHLGDNVLGSASLGEGWSESNGTYTHATGSTADLTFETTVEEGSIYLLEFDTSYTSDEYVRVGIGDRYRILCYKGSQTHATIPLLASGGTILYITPYSDTYVGSISNITLRKIQDNGTEYVLDVYDVETDNHDKNYGFWNTLIGKDTAENAVGSTRMIAIGTYALRDLQGGHRNIGIGTFAMSQLIGGESNISIGADSMLAVQKADECIALGFGTLYEGASRKREVAIGRNALKGTPESVTLNNIAIGAEAGRAVTTAKGNILVGISSGYKLTSGTNNIFVGTNAGKTGTTSYNNIIIGSDADVHSTGAGQVIVIGSGAKSTKNKQVVLGNDSIVETVLKGDLVVRGTDGVRRQIVFNEDGTCTWVVLE